MISRPVPSLLDYAEEKNTLKTCIIYMLEMYLLLCPKLDSCCLHCHKESLQREIYNIACQRSIVFIIHFQ